MTDLRALHYWIVDGFSYLFFKSYTSVRDDNLVRLLINEVNTQDPPSIYLIAVTNGDSSEIPSKDKVEKILQSEGGFRKRCFRDYNGQIGGTIKIDNKKKILKLSFWEFWESTEYYAIAFNTNFP